MNLILLKTRQIIYFLFKMCVKEVAEHYKLVLNTFLCMTNFAT